MKDLIERFEDDPVTWREACLTVLACYGMMAYAGAGVILSWAWAQAPLL